MDIGWIGAGVMGAPMAGHLLAAGHQLRIHTRTRARAEALLAEGARWCDTPAGAAEGAEVTCLMVGHPRDVEEVVLGKQGVLSGAGPGSYLVDFTTSQPALARRLAEEAANREIRSLDAPVSGGDVGARNATLSIMVGGDPAAFDALLPLLECVGGNVVYEGPPGAGQHTKMVNQVLIATNMVGVCEGLLYAQRAGLDPERVLACISGGAAASWSLSNLAPRILRNDFEPGFYVEHFVKDMDIALAECEAMNLDLPGLKLARGLYRRLVDKGLDQKGTQALYLALQELNVGKPPTGSTE